MALARDLVELEARLRDHAEVDLFASVERGGLLGTPECVSMLGRIRSTDPASVMRLCLQAPRIQNEELRPKLLDAELVATLPPETPGIARPTKRVVREMIDGKDLLVTSANFTFHGLRGNIEIGVRLGGSLAAEARKIFSHLVESRTIEEAS